MTIFTHADLVFPKRERGLMPPSPVKLWAVIRLLLGLGQMVGAMTGLTLLIETGLSEPTVWALIVTTALALISRTLFRSRTHP